MPKLTDANEELDQILSNSESYQKAISEAKELEDKLIEENKNLGG